MDLRISDMTLLEAVDVEGTDLVCVARPTVANYRVLFSQLAALFLNVANNLSDLTDVAAARTALGLGAAATLALDAVLQPSNNLGDLESAETARTNLGLGTAATLDLAAVLQAGNNLSDLTDIAAALTALGLDGGWTGAFATGDSRTATVVNGIITGVA